MRTTVEIPDPTFRKDRVFDSMREIWARLPQLDDSAEIIETDRDR